ncbi:calcium-translocating P-type ATPase, PMCA-type [Cytobacillus sp. Hz8]|uniref:calcium-translocating P-type ATPase, PMCA-type n=1 Tax=Cytobacillus sp. Hz8 TaxID=3347168 RepID=UPI0035D97EF9
MWSTKTIQEVLAELKSDPVNGLTNQEAETRLATFGKNEFLERKKPTFLRLFFDQINNWLIYILIFAAILSLSVGEISDAIIILIVILLNAMIGILQESKAEKALEELKKMTSPKAIVKRGGVLKEIPSELIVPGDIVIIDAGRYIPADLRLIETVNLKMEESSLTGESVPVDKDASWLSANDIPIAEQENMAFMSTVSTYGRAIGVVVNTGMNTEIGKIATMLGSFKREQTPLQLKLAELGKILGFGALLISAVIFLIGLIQGRNLLEMFLIAISLSVAAIPEGLPAIVSIVLALGVQRMIKHQAVVRKLPAVETLGAVSVICTDKTGTLTQNKMTVTKILVNNHYSSLSALQPKQTNERLFFEAMVLCNDAVATEEEQSGDPTEIALLLAAKQAGFDKLILDQKFERVHEFPFDSERKMMTTIHRNGSQYVVMVKGALEKIIHLSTYIMQDGQIIELDEINKERIKKQANQMSDEALRVLAIAYKEIPSSKSFTQDSVEQDLVFLGLTGMIDPPREEVKAAITACNAAGIRTVMITGDHPKTALAIAKELGIADPHSEALTGLELDDFNDKELSEKVKKVRVFARVSPDHKVKIVKALKKNGDIVSMTGDGVNDAPSLQQADVGVAMGKGGTDVAKGAADIVLTDDNFTTIVKAVEQGRNIYQNIKKSILFLLSCNLGEIVVLFLAILFGWPAPLTAIHILWINLITDTIPAISLGLDPDDPDVMKRRPRSIKESIFANQGGAFTIINGILIGIISLFAFITGLAYYSHADSFFSIHFDQIPINVLVHAQTLTFVTLSVSQLFHAINLRHPKKSMFQVGLFTNKYLLASIFIGVSIQMILVAFPVLNQFFEIVYLTWKDWLFVAVLSILPVLLNELYKAGKRIFGNE